MQHLFGYRKDIKLKRRNKSQKTWIRCSLAYFVWSLVGFVLLFHLYTSICRLEILNRELVVKMSQHPLLSEAEVIEDESIQMPPPRRRSPRAVMRKPKPPTTLIDEFLDEYSQIRHVFFPKIETAVDTMMCAESDKFYYYPGRTWLDTEGNPIQAHGGGIVYDERSSKYYWYGEYKDGPTYQAHKNGYSRVDIIGVACYSSKDLWTWKNEGIVLAAEPGNKTHDLHPSNVLERPKVVYNDRTRKYVMWMHVDNGNYTWASAGVAVADQPTGPFVYLGSMRPNGSESRDMTVFKDDDGTAYLIYSSEDNSELHAGLLCEDYLDVANGGSRVLLRQHREAPALFKHGGVYYMITSGCTGWAPNEALVHAAGSVMGPWEEVGNPCVGGGRVFRGVTFFAQGTHVVQLHGLPGSFIFMADRWNPADLRDSRYVWLPLEVRGGADRPLDQTFGFPVWPRVSVYWCRRWRLPWEWRENRYRGFGV